MALNDSYYIGSGIKLKVNITGEGFNQATNPYTIVATCGGKSVTYTQEDMESDSGNYYLSVDTSSFRSGTLKLIITAFVPDESFPNGYRKEIDVKTIGPLRNI